MKVLDKRAKFWGLINIVDLIIIFVVIIIAAGAYYKFSDRKIIEEKNVAVDFQVIIPNIRPDMAQAIKVGDKMVSGNSYTSVIVKDIQIKPGYSVNVDARGQRVESVDPFLVDVYVTNTGTTSLSPAVITMGGQEIRIGKEYNFRSRNYEFKGTVSRIEIKEMFSLPE
ncbi:MAG: DUF4330 domain-containing protein [Bacillota bacterium]